MNLTLRSRRFLGQFAASLVLLAFLLAESAGVFSPNLVNRLDAALYDLKLRVFLPKTVDERIVITDIDEKSLKEVGRWPWPRDKVAAMTSNLFQQYGVAAVGFDIIFSEPDQSSGLPVLEKLAQGPLAGDSGFDASLKRIRSQLDYDGRFAEALATGPAVLGYYFGLESGHGRVGSLPKPLLACRELQALGVSPEPSTGYSGNLARLQAQTPFAGFFNAQVDFDGVVRRMPMLVERDGQCYASLSLNTLRAGMGVDKVVVGATGSAALNLDGLNVPLDSRGMALVPYRATGAFAYVSAADIIAGRVPASALEGRIVLVGSTAPGLLDLRTTPVEHSFPGVEIHASLVSGVLDGTLKWSPPQMGRYLLIAVGVLGVLLAATLPWLSPVWAATATAGLLATLLGGDFYAWSVWNMSVQSAGLLLTVVALFILNMSWGFFVEARSKAQITKLFGQYVPPELVDEMAKDPASYSLRGESRVMTVLFSDIRDFTSISETLEAADLADMLNLYLSGMTRIVQENRGTIDKYIGDAIMAFWGAPLSDEQHARDGILTALSMQAALEQLNPQLEAQGWSPIKIGVGVNSGRMSVGNMGSSFRMAYTVMADAVNLASRLEGLTKQYGVGVLAGEACVSLCPDITFQRVDRVRVKGKQQPVAIYEPLGVTAQLPAGRIEESQRFEAMLDDYQACRWDEAEIKLTALRCQQARKLYDVYLDRLTYFRFNPPPPDWDGVFTFTSK